MPVAGAVSAVANGGVNPAALRPSLAVLPDAGAVMDRARGENFPVASHLLPRRHRQHLLALYGFARLVDQIGDAPAGDPDLLLDAMEGELDRIFAEDLGPPAHPLMQRLLVTVRACGIPRSPLEALIAANRQDQRIHSYDTFSELEGYCEKSANPVGHLVLHVFGAATPERLALSDRICTALQLAEHWQDILEDVDRGRVYVPAEDLRRFGCTAGDLVRSPAPERVRGLVEFEVARARALLDAGAPLIGTLRGRPRLAVAAFVAGGRSALGAITRAGYDVSQGAPRASGPARAAALLSVAWSVR
ncbi:MAG TPA: squalene synthase HpnC [Solirubrobacteraceae bacterium]|jgi:squalene synthase HpnC|nr:squalene synthase HpnC [Solirubrobacteraceae bacterium]